VRRGFSCRAREVIYPISFTRGFCHCAGSKLHVGHESPLQHWSPPRCPRARFSDDSQHPTLCNTQGPIQNRSAKCSVRVPPARPQNVRSKRRGKPLRGMHHCHSRRATAGDGALHGVTEDVPAGESAREFHRVSPAATLGHSGSKGRRPACLSPHALIRAFFSPVRNRPAARWSLET
jgi:hypothetical protein